MQPNFEKGNFSIIYITRSFVINSTNFKLKIFKYDANNMKKTCIIKRQNTRQGILKKDYRFRRD